MTGNDDVAYACQIDDPDDARRQRAGLETLFDQATTVEQIDGGLRLEVPREGNLAQVAADFAVVESDCCPWARYAVAFEREHAGLVLEITGDEQAAELIRQYTAGEIPEGLDGPTLD